MRFLFLVLVLTSTSLVSAQDTPSNTEVDAELDQAARLLFESGTRAYDAGNFQEALSRYTNAFELSGRSGLLYNIAICHDRLEHKEEAATFYERFVAENPESSQVGVSRSRAAILRTSLASVEVTPDVNPDVAPDVEPLVEHVSVPPEPPVDDGAGDDVGEEPPAPATSRSLVGPIASFAVAGVGLVTFAVAGLISSSRLSDAEGTCMGGGGCNESELDGVDRTALIADIGLGLAIAGTAVGVVLLLVGGGDDDSESEARTTFTPIASTSSVGAQLNGSF